MQNRRFLNINIHGISNHWSLGLIKLSGSVSSLHLKEIVSKKLLDFGLDLNSHIVGCTSDGAAVMVKFGVGIEPFHHQCIAHTIHLAVGDVLYSKTPKNIEHLGEDSDTVIDNSDEDSSLSENDTKLINGDEFSDLLITKINGNYANTINKVRRICKLFRKSPLKNEKLQDFVKGDQGRELKLKLDCKTRWGSLLNMLERFIKLKNSFPKALRVIDSTETLDDVEWHTLQCLVDALNPVQMVE